MVQLDRGQVEGEFRELDDENLINVYHYLGIKWMNEEEGRMQEVAQQFMALVSDLMHERDIDKDDLMDEVPNMDMEQAESDFKNAIQEST